MPQGRHSSYVVTLTPRQRVHLEALQRQTAAPMGVIRRARIILLLDEGHPITEIARLVGIHRLHVYKWIKRWCQAGFAGLEDKPGRGAKPRGAWHA
jgi:Helix-turn-helix domain